MVLGPYLHTVQPYCQISSLEKIQYKSLNGVIWLLAFLKID